MSSTPQHWNQAFGGDHTERGWYQKSATPSWQLIGEYTPNMSAVDVGGGASVWVDEALQRGFEDVTVLDWSPVALEIARQRLGEDAERITWVNADILTWHPNRTYDLWHDRAVLHFLREDSERAEYLQTLLHATSPGSVAVIGGFAASGPDFCAGLPVRKQSPESFEELLAPHFRIDRYVDQTHVRPDSDTQDYLWVRAIRI